MGYIMRKIRILLVAVLTSVILAPSAFSTNLAEVYQSAVENDPVLGAAKQEYAARKELVPQTRAALLPNVNMIGTLSNNRIDFPGGNIVDTDPTSPTFGQQINVDGDSYKQNSWQAQLVQPILDFPAYFTYRGAQARSKGASYEYTAAEQALIFRVVQAYLNILRSQDLVDSTSAEEAAVKRQQEQVQQRFDVGLVAITDVLDATAAYDNAVVQRIVAEGAQGVFFETLFTLTGISYDQVDRISGRLPIVNPVPIDEEVWVAAALANNPIVLASRAGSGRRATRPARAPGRSSADDRCAGKLQPPGFGLADAFAWRTEYAYLCTADAAADLPRRLHEFAGSRGALPAARGGRRRAQS